MVKYTYVNGVKREMTQEEENIFNQEQTEWLNQNPPKSRFEVLLDVVREKRNSLLAETDYLALSDQTMTAEMTAYRQALRDITNGLTTVEDVEAVVFPEKPGA